MKYVTRQIHALFSNKELKLLYNSIDKLKEHEQIKKFIKWIRKKPIYFTVKTKARNNN
jgi:5-methylcytosine-specific restriction protein A